MDRTPRSVRGQMIVEVTIISGLILLIISSALSISMLIRKRIKHGFVESSALEPISEKDLPKILREDLDNAKNSISKSLTYFDYQKWPKVIEKLSEEGWSEEGKLKSNGEEIRFFKRGLERMEIIDTKEGKVGLEK